MENKNIELQKNQQISLYNKPWQENAWDGEKLFPVLLPLGEILELSTAILHVHTQPNDYNVIGSPRSGTIWATTICSLLIKRFPWQNPIIGHFHSGIIEDFLPDKKVIFIYRDIRDAIISGYFYVKSGLHQGTMHSTTADFNRLSQNEGIRNHIIMYMKYRMPVINYWYNIDHPNVTKVKYEDMLIDRFKEIKRISKGLSLKSSVIRLFLVYWLTSFKHQTRGRKRGEEDRQSHQRKGISGEWKRCFSNEHVEMFQKMGGDDFLKMMGYQRED